MKKFHCDCNNNVIFSRGKKVYCFKNTRKLFNIQRILPDYFSLIRRLFRSEIHNIKCINNNFLISVKGKILFYKNQKKVFQVKIDQGSRPLRQGIEVLNNKMFYGDYWKNIENQSVNLYSVDIYTFKKEIFYTFLNVRHIHFVQKDKLNQNTLLIGTGDSDSESGIYALNILNTEISVIGEGSQKYRAVSILQVGNKLVWGSDDHNGSNHIYSFDRDSSKLTCLHEIGGPAYYSTINSEGDLFIATTIEDRKRHSAIIYTSNNQGKNWSIHKVFKKDIWHLKYFGYGVIEFISGQEKHKKLFYNLVGLKEVR